MTDPNQSHGPSAGANQGRDPVPEPETSPAASSARGDTSPSIPSGAPLGPPAKKRHRFRNVFLLLLLAVMIGAALWTWGAVSFAYSSGERTGFVQNFSKEGWLCKTWEGELAVMATPGAEPEVFKFTVRDDSVATALQQVLPARVALTYKHHRGVPTSCFGETAYYITGFRTVD